MPNENKTGSYEEFNVHKASWVCPHCHRDTLKLEDHYRYHGKLKIFYTFFCVYCQFDSAYYNFYIKEKDSFNAAYRKLTRDLKWARSLLKKGYVEGKKDGFRMSQDLYKIKEMQRDFKLFLIRLKRGILN